jgi:outer membrane receptor protein involved in Fe transport
MVLRSAPHQLAVALSLLSGMFAAAPASAHPAERTAVIEEVRVVGVRERLQRAGALADTILKTEVIGAEMIDNRNAVNLSEALANTSGINVSNECSMCAVKRIMLNGMKGEQTTILVDGLQMYAMISGFYAVDAIPTTGVDRIEVARGAGASLIAAEAIGGVVNIISAEPTRTGVELDASIGENGYDKASIYATGMFNEGSTRLSLVGQRDRREQMDADGNGVNESPLQDNRNLILRLSQDIGSGDNFTLRAARTDAVIFGGPMLGESFADGVAASIDTVLGRFAYNPSEQLFAGNDVRERFVGNAWETTEWISTEREELAASWLHELNARWNMTLSATRAEHRQDSFYEGFDYRAEDIMYFGDARFNVFLNAQHRLTFGADLRDERMRSDSRAGSANPDYASDAFDYQVNGFYLKDTWSATPDIELSLALRYDTIKADFTDPSKPGREIDEQILSPRLDARWLHGEHWTSRFSAGRGYRAPLSFFETDHGILDAAMGFAIDINALERSNSLTYALSYEDARLTTTASIAWTEVENLAAISETASGVPLLTQLNEDARVLTTDIALSYQFTDRLTVSLTAERFGYDDAFKSSYAIAPIETRVTASVDWMVGEWDLFAYAVWTGSRNLSDYAYEGYERLMAGGAVDPGSLKSTDAPAWWTLDLKASRDLGERFNVYVGVANLFDYTQAGDEQTPLFFDADGGFDVAYIYAPLRGREAYAGIKFSF